MAKDYKKFRVYVVKGAKPYYDVYIFNNRQSMRLFSKNLFNNGSNAYSRQEAATHSFDAYKTVNGKEELAPVIGAILFHKDNFGPGIVSHEIAHAVNYFFLKQKIRFDLGNKKDKGWQGNDEVYATILGYMVNQFWEKANKQFKRLSLNERY